MPIWRRVLVDYPAQAVDGAGAGLIWLARVPWLTLYCLVIGAGGLVCLVTAGLWLALALAGVPLP